MAGLVEGDAIERMVIGETTSDRSGRYSLGVDFTALGQVFDVSSLEVSVLKRQGAIPVNIEIVASTDSGDVTSFGTTAWVDDGFKRATLHEPLSAGGLDPLAARAVGSARTLDLTLQDSGPALTAPLATRAGIPNGCTLVTSYPARDVTVGQVSATAGSGFSHQFHYLAGASSSVGAGLSISGSWGTWTQSGTFTQARSAETSFPSRSSAGTWLAYTKFNFAKVKCNNGATGSSYYRVIPVAHYGGATSPTSSAPSATNCTSYTAGSTLTRTSSSAVTYSNGAKVSSIVGFDLSMKSGFNAASKYVASFSSTRSACGTNAGPATSAQVVIK